MTQQTLKYPIGVQSFEKIRKGGYIYVDKTKYIWDLVSKGNYYFLSRPRRFGKSLLLSTIEAYFQGKRELFEGLAISDHEKEWVEFPVLHLDLNVGTYSHLDELKAILSDFVAENASKHGIYDNIENPIPLRFGKLVQSISEKYDRNIVILIDEYDKPLLNSVERQDVASDIQGLLKAFYGVLKSYDAYIKFAMLTGVARFSKVSVFSDLNNLNDISLDEQYNALCGVSESELDKNFTSSIETLAQRLKLTPAKAKEELKKSYDGYHFCKPEFAEGIYNPFSLLNCFSKNDLGDYWFESGTPTFLIKMLVKEGMNMSKLSFEMDESELKGVNVPERSVKSLLYQTGYVTIKDFDPRFRIYTVGIPNEEVRSGLYRMSFVIYGCKNENEFSISSFVDDLRKGNVDSFMERLKALISDIPYEQARQSEAIYHNVLFLLFTMLGYRTESEHHMSQGRSDLMVKTDSYIYLFEFKYDGTAEAAMRQINERQYDAPYKADGREIVKIGVNFSSKERNIDEWIVEKQ